RLEQNLADNVGAKGWRVCGHVWGDRNDSLFPAQTAAERFDMILIADTLWMPDQHHNLLRDLTSLLAPGGSIFGVAGLHTGQETLDKFFRLAQNDYGLRILSKAPFRIPIGAGFCEEQEWEPVGSDEEISNDSRERLRFLYSFELAGDAGNE
ncbi:hypothetical protein HDU91_006971, partial [Kappamyces sp. JEL0680]